MRFNHTLSAGQMKMKVRLRLDVQRKVGGDIVVWWHLLETFLWHEL